MSVIEPAPTDEEAAAIVAAFAPFDAEAATSPEQRVSGWTLAMRNPELSFDELREMTKAAR